MPLAQLRVGADDRLEVVQRLLEMAEVSKSLAEITSGQGEFRLERQGTLVFRHRTLELPQLLESVGQIIVCLGIVRPGIDRLLEMFDCLCGLSSIGQADSQGVLC